MGGMKSFDYPIDVDELMREIERYLAAVEVFRAAGCDVGGIRRRGSRRGGARERRGGGLLDWGEGGKGKMRGGAFRGGVVPPCGAAPAGTAAVQALITGAQIKDGTVQSRDI